MERERPLLLPPPPAPPLLAPPPAELVLLPPPRAPVSITPLPPRPSATLRSTLRSIRPPPISAIPSPVMNVVKNVFTDLGLFRRCYNFLLHTQRKKAPPTYPRAALPGGPRPLLNRFLDEADMDKLLKLAAVIGGSVLLLYLISLGLGVGVQEEDAGADGDEDEEALIAGKLPAAARRQLLLLTLPLVPRAMLVLKPRPLPRWPPRQGQAGTSAVPKVPSTTNPHSDIEDTEDKAEKLVLKNNTNQPISRVPNVEALMAQDAKTMLEMESNNRMQNFLKLLKKAADECKGSNDLDLNLCNELGGKLESFKDYLASKLEAGEEEPIVQSAPERMKGKTTLSEPRKTVSDNRVSLKKTKQSDESIRGDQE